MTSAQSSTREWLVELSRYAPAECERKLQAWLRELLCKNLGLSSVQGIGSRERIIDLGVESLQAVQFKTELERYLLCTLPSTLLFDYPTLEDLSRHLMRDVLALEPAPPVDSMRATAEAVVEAEDLTRYADVPPEQVRLLLARAERKLQRYERRAHVPIAIVGMACRLPGNLRTPQEFWEFLVRRGDAITEVPAERWDVDAFYDPTPQTPGKTCSRRGGFLSDVDRFDADLFGISPREAEQVDPQQRLLLEVAREALEDAGRAPSSLHGSPTGVFVGMRGSEYHSAWVGRDPKAMGAHMGTGGAPSAGAGRISYTFGFRGPAIAIDTACSSSLVAIHQACQSLRLGECDLALAAAVNLLLDPLGTIALSQARMLSPEGRCKTFDASADGYVRAEGCVVLLLKPLDVAERDGDHVYAVLRGSAVNQDGASGGLTVPSGPAQERVIRDALLSARVQPYQVGYVEAHGTGTLLGDPIEVHALNRVFTPNRYHGMPLFIGSVKTNIGHLEMAAGLAGLLKVVLALDQEYMVPQLGFDAPNPHVDWASGVAQVVTRGTEWPRSDIERVAAVSSFGFAGTNACAILAEAPAQRKRVISGERQRREAENSEGAARGRYAILPLSAGSPEALTASFERHLTFLDATKCEVRQVCRAAALTRDHHPFRRGLVVDSIGGARTGIQRILGEAELGVRRTRADNVRVAFLFTGQGSQYVGMGKTLYACGGAFKQALDRCAKAMSSQWNVDLRELMFEASVETLSDTRYAQPAIFALEYALAQQWLDYGIRPDVVLGHSVGEFAAACVAGILEVEDAARLIVARGRLMAEVTVPGAMLSANLDLEQAQSAVGDRPLAIAAVNAPRSVVFSGARGDIERFAEELAGRGVPAQRLQASHAFHSPLMEPILAPFRELCAGIAFGKPALTVVSSVTGGIVQHEMSDPAYFTRQICLPVRFSEALATLLTTNTTVHLEVGPNPTLTSLARGQLEKDDERVWVPSLRPPRDEPKQVLHALASMYEAGLDPDWSKVWHGEPAVHVRLPLYPYQRKRHWISEVLSTAPELSAEQHELLGRQVPISPSSGLRAVYDAAVSLATAPWLSDHALNGVAIYPATAYVVAAAAAATERNEDGSSVELRDIVIHEPFLVLDEAAFRLQFSVSEEQKFSFSSASIQTSETAEWRRHVSGSWLSGEDAQALLAFNQAQTQFAKVSETCTEALDLDAFYARLAADGLGYGPAFRQLTEVLLDAEGRACRIRISPNLSTPTSSAAHARRLDAILQGAIAVLPNVAGKVSLPFAIESFALRFDCANACQAYAIRTSEVDAKVHRADIALFDASGRAVGLVRGLTASLVSAASLVARSGDASKLWHHVEWVEQTAEAPEIEPCGTWLIVGDGAASGAPSSSERATVAHDLAWDLEQAGFRAELIAGRGLLQGDTRDLIELLEGAPDDTLGVVFLPALGERESREEFDGAEASVFDRASRLLAGAAHLVQQMRRRAWVRPPRLWLVTRGAQPAGATFVANPSHAVLSGLGVTLGEEWRDLSCMTLDLDATLEEHDGRVLFRELTRPSNEPQVAYRGGRRLVPRLERGARPMRKLTDGLTVPKSADFRFQIEEYGSLSRIGITEHTCRAPGPDEVQVRVRAAGLNFKDVLHTLGLLKEYSEARGLFTSKAVRLGFEACGIVSSVGENVTDIVPGQPVIVVGEGLLSSSVTLPRADAIPKPDGLTDEQGAGLPTAFLTALYSLDVLARLGPSDTVLIHAAAGGVGQAALQLAQAAGARVIATASQAKRKHLHGQGVLHVFDSRSLDFAEDVLRVTDGEGVSIVINSLKGAFAESSLRVLREGGTFIELGKLETLSPEHVARERPDVTYHQFDLGDVFAQDPSLKTRLLGELTARFARGELTALPVSEFDVNQATTAFRFLAQGKNIGKVVLTLPEVEKPKGREARVRADATYLISGGLGGLGLLTADWLAQRGAGRLALMSRRAPSGSVQAELERIERLGTEVRVVNADVCDKDAISRLCAELGAGDKPLRGVVHAAGVLADALIENLTLAEVEPVLGPKILGALNLHAATLHAPLDFFVCYGSAVTQLASQGQAAYAAANAFLGAFSWFQRGLGRAGASIDWALWSDVGMGTQLSAATLSRYVDRGLTPLSAPSALLALEQIIEGDLAHLVVIGANWKRYVTHSRGRPPALLERFIRKTARKSAARGLLLQEIRALPQEQRRSRLALFVRTELAAVAALPGPDAIDVERAFTELGLDSLLALDLRNSLETQLDCPLAASTFFEYPNVMALVEHLTLTLFDGHRPALAD